MRFQLKRDMVAYYGEARVQRYQRYSALRGVALAYARQQGKRSKRTTITLFRWYFTAGVRKSTNEHSLCLYGNLEERKDVCWVGAVNVYLRPEKGGGGGGIMVQSWTH